MDVPSGKFPARLVLWLHQALPIPSILLQAQFHQSKNASTRLFCLFCQILLKSLAKVLSLTLLFSVEYFPCLYSLLTTGGHDLGRFGCIKMMHKITFLKLKRVMLLVMIHTENALIDWPGHFNL